MKLVIHMNKKIRHKIGPSTNKSVHLEATIIHMLTVPDSSVYEAEIAEMLLDLEMLANASGNPRFHIFLI